MSLAFPILFPVRSCSCLSLFEGCLLRVFFVLCFCCSGVLVLYFFCGVCMLIFLGLFLCAFYGLMCFAVFCFVLSYFGVFLVTTINKENIFISIGKTIILSSISLP